MPGLLDIAPSFRTVTVNGSEITVPGVSAEGVAYMLTKFPVVREAMAGKAPEDAFTLDSIMKLAPEALRALMACGLGYVNNPEAEQRVGSLSLETQLDIVDAIIRETLPGGVGPFVERLTDLANRNGVGLTNTAATT